MRQFMLHLCAMVAIALSFIYAASIAPGFLRVLALIAAYVLLRILFIPRWPRSNAIREALKIPLKKYVRVSVEIVDK